MKHLLKGVLILFTVIYPFLVGWSLSHGYFVWVSGLLLCVGVLRLFSPNNHLMWPLTSFAIVCGGLSFLLKDAAWLKMYPVLMSVGALIIFAWTLIRPPSMIERFARVVEPDLPETGVIWTRQVTKVWCVFFIFNALVALYTVLYSSTKIWVIYNGFVSYMLMGMLFLGEFILRKRQQRLHQQQAIESLEYSNSDQQKNES